MKKISNLALLNCRSTATTYRNVLKNSSPALVARRNNRNDSMRSYFNDQKRQGRTSAYIYTQLAAKWCLSEETVEQIVWQRGRYRVTVLLTASKQASL